MAGSKIEYWDSCIFLALLKRETNHEPGELAWLEQQAHRFDNGELVLATSSITITEILAAGFDDIQNTRIKAMYQRDNFVFIDASRRVCELASDIRNFYLKNPVKPESNKSWNVATPDAIHIASAITLNQRAAQTVRLLTFDCNDKPKTKELGLTGLSGLIANQYPLEIVRPAHIQK